MLEEIDLEGEWWFPYKKDLIFNGDLTFSQSKGGHLVLYGSEDPFLILDTSEKQDSTETLILGKLSDGRNVTLQSSSKPSKASVWRNHYSYSKRTFRVDFIFIGHHFEKIDDIKFENVSVEYSNIDKWISLLSSHDLIGSSSISSSENNEGFDLRYRFGKPIDIKIENNCDIQFFSFPSIKLEFGLKADISNKYFVKFHSYGSKDLHDYIKLQRSIQDFLNFITTHEIFVSNMIGEVRINFRNHSIREHVQILYRSSISKKMDKISVISPNFPIYDINKIKILIKRWFALREKITSVYDLYFGTMYNNELYLTNKFLMLSEALEIYGEIRSGNEDSRKIKNEQLDYAIKSLESSNLNDSVKEWIKQLVKQKRMLSFKEKMLYIYENYAELLPILSTVIGNKEQFATLVSNYRNKLTHANMDYDRLNNEELFWKYKDIQLILQMCILSELGYSISEMKSLYLIDKLQNRNIQ